MLNHLSIVVQSRKVKGSLDIWHGLESSLCPRRASILIPLLFTWTTGEKVKKEKEMSESFITGSASAGQCLLEPTSLSLSPIFGCTVVVYLFTRNWKCCGDYDEWTIRTLLFTLSLPWAIYREDEPVNQQSCFSQNPNYMVVP